jgi:hypothetical protein
MGNWRSVDGAYRTHREGCRKRINTGREHAPSLWRSWKREFRWDERCDEYDVHLDRLRLEKQRAAIEEMNEQHALIAKGFLQKVIARLQTLNVETLSPGQLPIWLREATTVHRRALGEATELVAQQVSGALTHESADPIPSDPETARVATELLALLSRAPRVPGDPGGDGLAAVTGALPDRPAHPPAQPVADGAGEPTDRARDLPDAASAREDSAG